jgi:hypothetical protein
MARLPLVVKYCSVWRGRLGIVDGVHQALAFQRNLLDAIDRSGNFAPVIS